MGAAGGPQLVAAERVEQTRKAEDGRRGQSLDLRFLGAAPRQGNAKLPADRGKARLGQQVENAARAGCGHGSILPRGPVVPAAALSPLEPAFRRTAGGS